MRERRADSLDKKEKCEKQVLQSTTLLNLQALIFLFKPIISEIT